MQKRQELRDELGLAEDYGVEHTDAAHKSKRQKSEPVLAFGHVTHDSVSSNHPVLDPRQ